MKRFAGGTMFSTVFQTEGHFAIGGKQFHTGVSPGRPDNRKSLTEHHQESDWLGCN